ncbi:MAG: iron-containing alcohol dehydrogenase [Rhodocyclaceae bacterium]|nr:iron-containing alcohol dehydrogenase [Rhodocyclaceae bacterium]
MHTISRLRIAGLGIASKLIPFPTPKCFVGPDSSLVLSSEIAKTGIKRLTLITSAGMYKRGEVNPILKTLRAAGVKVDVFHQVEPDPGYETIEAGVKHLRDTDAQAVFAVGGGSSIDGAKTMVACYANNCHPSKLIGLFKVRKMGVPFYAAPTTAGTGSEVTVAAVVSDKAARQKHAIIDPKLVPLMVALDPKLMIGLPADITAATGMDALTHAVEAYVSTLANAETDALAMSAVAAIVANLPTAYRKGKDLKARENMAQASYDAGLAFTRSGVGYVHAISHQLGGLYHVPHGFANAVVMPYVLDRSMPKIAHRLAELARGAGINPTSRDDVDLAEQFIARIRKMNRDMDIPETIAELRRADFEIIIDRALKEAHGTYAVPVYFSFTDCHDLLMKLLPKKS